MVTLFYYPIKSLLLGMKCVFKLYDLQRFGIKLNKLCVIFSDLKLWVAVARHNFNKGENLKYLI